MEGNQILIKLLSIGDKEVGKSCIIKRYCEGRFVQKYITTIGVDYGVKKMTVGGKKIAVNFFDLSGDDDYAVIRNPFMKDAQVKDSLILGNTSSFRSGKSTVFYEPVEMGIAHEGKRCRSEE
jgi:GTPase SAR1 family protein